MSGILRPVTDDSQIGYDQFNQLAWQRKEGDSIVFSLVADVRNKTCIICNQKWEATGPSIGDQYRWELIKDYVHETCFARYVGLNERSRFFGALVGAKVRFNGIHPISNGYWPESYTLGWMKRPWYLATLLDHPFEYRLGVRKRVSHIEIRPTAPEEVPLDYKSLEKAFANEDVTKHFNERSCMLHSWSEENDRIYIRMFAQVLGLQYR